MSPEERSAFEEQLRSDPSLRMELERHRKVSAALNYGLYQQRKARLRQIEEELAVKTPVRMVARRRLHLIAAAACILILIAAGAHIYAHRTYTPQAVAESLFVPSHEDVFRNREEYVTSLGERFAQADQLFRDGEYEAAGHAYLVIIKENTLLKEQAEWSLTLSYYAINPESPQFRILFERILNDTSHDFHSQAEELQRVMNSRLYKIVN
jgi:hypothetical protein